MQNKGFSERGDSGVVRIRHVIVSMFILLLSRRHLLSRQPFYFGNFALQEYPESEGLQRAHVMCRSTNMEC